MVDKETLANDELPKENKTDETPITEPIQSNDNDELVIELDESPQAEPVASPEPVKEKTIIETPKPTPVVTDSITSAEDELVIEKDAASAELSPEAKVVAKPKTTKAKPKAKHKPAPKAKKEKAPKDPNKKSKKGLIIILVIIALVLGGGAYMFTMQADKLATWLPILVEKGILEGKETIEKIDTNITSEEASKEETLTDEDAMYEEEIAPESTEAAIEEDEVAVEEVVETISASLGAAAAVDLSTSWVIGIASVSTEAQAKKTSSKASNQGLSSSFYYIPTYQTNGPELYKVYVGPYSSKSQAEAALSSAQEFEAGAYIMKVK